MRINRVKGKIVVKGEDGVKDEAVRGRKGERECTAGRPSRTLPCMSNTAVKN